MSELRIESWTMPAADLGPENPLPPLYPREAPRAIENTTGLPQEMIGNVSIGHLSLVLPYMLQDHYSRQLSPKGFRVAVLENEILRATFLLEYGGRLWSLFHKRLGIELLEVNPVLQLANLAIRNAWFCGGVEWNIGTIGHSPFTCSPLFAAKVDRNDGTPILRMYEWERFRGVPFQIDAYLPDGSPVLFVKVRITNPNKYDVPMYWWTNIAVPETPETRVIVPAESAYCLGCGQQGLAEIPLPLNRDTDITYPAQVDFAADFFFHTSGENSSWIAALNSQGRGIVHLSTRQLKGRKLWVWGKGRGGKNWQKFLSPPGEGYIEIQAGLTRTQLEHILMPSDAEWSWVEAYGLLEAEPDIIHGSDWSQVRRMVAEKLNRLISFADLENELQQGQRYSDAPPHELLQRGSGWGALEQKRRAISGEPPMCSDGLLFDDASLGDEQLPWISLLEEGSFPEEDPHSPPNGFIVGDEWQNLLEIAVREKTDRNWAAWFHLGIMRYHAGDREGALQAWNQSLDCKWTPWTARNLGALAWVEGRFDDAAELLTQACKASPSLIPLTIECGNCLIDAGRASEWLDLLDALPISIRHSGRIRLLEAQASLDVGDLKTAQRFFDEKVVVADLREGDHSLSDLWLAYQTKRLMDIEGLSLDDSLRRRVRSEYPIPKDYDFRMSAENEL